MASEARFYLVDAEWFAAEFANCFRANHAVTEENNRKACLRYLRVADRDYRLGPAPLQRMRVIAWLLSAGAFAVGWLGVRPLAEGAPAWLRLAFDLILVLILTMTVLQGLWLGWHWFWPKAHVAISQAVLEEGLPGLALNLEKHYDMAFLRGLYDELGRPPKSARCASGGRRKGGLWLGPNRQIKNTRRGLIHVSQADRYPGPVNGNAGTSVFGCGT